MGVEIYSKDIGEPRESHVLACNTSDVAFGLRFMCTIEELKDFLKGLPKDARRYDREELERLWYEYSEEPQDI